MRTVVYKLGGSLLALPDLARRLSRVLDLPLNLPGEHVRTELPARLLVVGGGPIADAVRHWDRVHGLGEAAAHALALRSMSFNAHYAAAILDGSAIVATREEARAVWAERRIAILDAAQFIDAEELASQDVLPRSWNVTSDSIAAYIALHWPADELVLLKSAALPSACDLATAVDRGLVDRHFPNLTGRLASIRWCNLREEGAALHEFTL
jgi:5-(aminomethyl)-3-furanmethanol phosphate kinase